MASHKSPPTARFSEVLKAKGGQTQYYGVPNNPLGECYLVKHPDHISVDTGDRQSQGE